MGSTLVRSNVTIPTTSFSRVLFFTNDVMCRALWRHRSSLPHQFSILKTWGVDSPTFLPALDYTQRPYCSHSKNLNSFLHFYRSRLTQGACEGSKALSGLFKKVSKSEVPLTLFLSCVYNTLSIAFEFFVMNWIETLFTLQNRQTLYV